MALHDVNAVVTITTNAVKAIDDGKKLKQIYADINEQLNKMRAEGKTDTSEFKQMQKLAEDTKAKINEMLRGMELIDKVMGDISGHIGKDLNRALRETSKEFNKTSSSTDEGKAKLEKLRDVVADLKRELSDRRGLTMSLKDAEAQLKNLNNASLDKLKQGLQAVQEEAAKTTSATTRERYQGYAKQYRAQIAVNELGVAGHADLSQMNTEQLRAEQKRLQSLYTATEGADGFFRISDDAINRLQAVNTELKKAIDEERQITELRSARKQTEEVMSKLNFDQAVSLKDLNTALKNYELQLKEVKGVDEDATRRIEEDMKRIKAARNELNTTYIRPMAQYPGNYSLEELQEASKAGKEQFARMKPDELGYNQLKRDIQEIDAAIEQMTPKWHELAQAQQKEAEASEIVIRAYRGEKVSLDELTIAEKALQEQVKKMEGVNLDPDDTMKLSQTKDKLQDIRELIDEISLDGLDFDSEDGLSTASVERLETALKNLEAQEKRLSGNQKAEAEEVARKKRMVQEQIQKCKQQTQDFANAEKVAGETGKHSVYELQQAYNTLQQKLMSLNTGQKKEIRETQLQMKKLKGAIDEVTQAASKQNSVWSTAVKNITAYVGVFGMFNMIKNKLQEILKLNLAFSDQLANIRKVSGLAMSDITQLTKNLAKIDTRSSIKELNELAYVGSKLGFGNYGIEGLESFVKSAVKVNNALKEDLGEDSMMAISKLVEVMGLIPKMGVEKAMDSAGSAIFKLASTSTATGGNIIEFSKRLMGLANVSHITTDQLLALGSASDAMGLMPEVSATAFNKVFTSIQSNTKAIEQSLQMQKGELAALINEGKTMEAIVTVFDKMHGMNMDQLKAQGVFKALGSDGARLNNVMITMSDRIDMLKTHLHTSSQAFSEGSAVAQEYAIQMETAEAYMQRAANMWEKAFVNPEGIDLTKEFAKAWYDVSKSLTQTEASATVIKIVLQGIFGIMKLIVEMIPALITGFATWGMWAGGAALITKIRELGGLIAAISTAIRGLSFAGWAGIIAGVAMGVATLYSHFKSLNEELQRNSEFMKGFKKDLSDLNTEYGKGEAELRRYKKAIDEANKGTKQRQAAIQTFNSKFGQYMKNLLTEKSTAIDVANAYNEVTKALRAKLALQLKEKDINEQVLPREQWRAERRTEYEQRVQAAGLGQYGADWITGFAQDNQGKNINDLVRQIGKQYYNLPQQIIDEVATQAAAGNREFNNYGNIINSKFLDKANALLAAGSFLRQDRAAENAMRKVNKKWKPEQDAIDSYLADQNKQEPITPIDSDRLTKAELREQQKAEAEYKQALRKELQDAQRDSDAIISKIEEWYRLQETIITSYAADGTWTQKQADMMIDQLNMAKNQALADARRGISGRDEKSWEITKQRIGDLMFDTSDMSQHLLDDILKVKLENVRTALGNIDKAGVEGISSTAMRDKLNKNAAGNDREVQRILNNSTKEVEKMLKQYDFLQQAIDQFDNRLTQLGLLTESARAAAKRIQDAANANPAETLKPNYTAPATEEDIQRQRRQSIATAAMKFIQNGSKSMAVNYEDSDELAEWLRELTEATVSIGQNGMEFHFSSWAETFQEDFDKWLRNSSRYKQEIQAFYLSLVDAEDNYYKKRKESYNFEKQQQEQRFRAAGYTDEEERTTTELENKAKVRDTGIGATFWEQQGLGSIAEDPEVLLIQKRMEWRAREVADIEQQLAQKEAAWAEERAARIAAGEDEAAIDAEFAQRRMGLEDLLKERQTALLDTQILMATKISQEMQKRVQTINSLTKPIQDGAQKIGKKFGEMIRGVEDDSLTWKEIWQSMAQAVGDSIIDMMAQYAQNMIMEKMMNDQSKSEALSKAQVDVAAGTASAAAKTVGQLGWWGLALIPVIAAVLHGLLAAAFASNNSNNTNSPAKKVKLASGMLTYDEGNVQTVVGDDGRVYKARSQKSLPSGVSMITEPIATTVNGQQALVGERGPEIVIGRKTTRAIQMNRPDLLRDLVMFDKGMTTRKARTFDEGNLSDLASAIRPTDMPSGQATSQQQTDLTSEDARALTAAIGVFAQTVAAMQKNGIPAKIQKYGTGGLIDEVQSGLKFVSKYK
ncbi:MAG: hypothetical protein J6X07_08905 [Prevotella sp.]|nr:hypothetical protein [Prevotella sp.]